MALIGGLVGVLVGGGVVVGVTGVDEGGTSVGVEVFGAQAFKKAADMAIAVNFRKSRREIN
jgi:hypothetical protein